jgi:hypothetical protein
VKTFSFILIIGISSWNLFVTNTIVYDLTKIKKISDISYVIEKNFLFFFNKNILIAKELKIFNIDGKIYFNPKPPSNTQIGP